jgi:hypothetical protein
MIEVVVSKDREVFPLYRVEPALPLRAVAHEKVRLSTNQVNARSNAMSSNDFSPQGDGVGTHKLEIGLLPEQGNENSPHHTFRIDQEVNDETIDEP